MVTVEKHTLSLFPRSLAIALLFFHWTGDKKTSRSVTGDTVCFLFYAVLSIVSSCLVLSCLLSILHLIFFLSFSWLDLTDLLSTSLLLLLLLLLFLLFNSDSRYPVLSFFQRRRTLAFLVVASSTFVFVIFEYNNPSKWLSQITSRPNRGQMSSQTTHALTGGSALALSP